MLGFDFGTIGFHAKSALNFIWMSAHVLSPSKEEALANTVQVISEHSQAIEMFWWS